MAQLDISWLRVFIEVYRTGSVSLAAERLGIEQARASGVLTKLRRHFGDQLFARTSRAMEPTPFAHRIYPDAQMCVERLSASVGRDKFDPDEANRHFQICMTDISEIVVLPVLVNQLKRYSRSLSIGAEHISSESAHRLEAGDVDLAVGYMPRLGAGFYQQTLFQQGFVCLASKNHPRLRTHPTKRSFLKEGHVVVTTSGTGHAIVDKELARRGIDRRVVLHVPSFLGVARIVAQTELLAIVPRRLGEALAEQEAIDIFSTPVPLPTYAVKLHWHKRFHADAGNAWLRKTIAQLLTS